MNLRNECVGASVAVLVNQADGTESVVAILRDNKPDIRYANHWELLGGTAEPGEDAIACAFREAQEESSVSIEREEALWVVRYDTAAGYVGFIAVRKDEETVRNQLRLGEGQACALMPIPEFLSRTDVVPDHQSSLRAFQSGITSGTVILNRRSTGTYPIWRK